MTEFLRDSGVRPLLVVQSVPVGLYGWTEGSASVPAGSRVIFTVTTYPGDSRLSLWDQLFSVRVDTNDNDHLWPGGASLTSDQRQLSIDNWIDFASSSDISNVRVHKIIITNSGVADKTVYLLYKAYTFASSGGTGS